MNEVMVFDHTKQDNERAERPVLHRTFEAVAVEVEGRTVDVRVVPFGEVARVSDPPDHIEYDEEWLPGVFDHQLRAANRLHANYEHQKGISNVVGHGITMRSEQDGYHASFKIHATQNGETALELIRDGALPGVSLEAHPVEFKKNDRGVVQRVKAHLMGIAFCRQGAFMGAQVLAVRTPPEKLVDEALLPYDMDPGLVERLRAGGFVLPDRYQAHPDKDTPPEGGTSEDGTRQTDHTTSLEDK